MQVKHWAHTCTRLKTVPTRTGKESPTAASAYPPTVGVRGLLPCHTQATGSHTATRAHATPNSEPMLLKLVLVLGERRHGLLETLALTRSSDDLDDLIVLERVSHHRVPMMEHHLREGLAAGVLPKEASEAEGLGDGQVGLDVVQRGARPIGLLDDGATLAVERRVHAAHGVLGTLDLDEEDRLLQARLGGQAGREEDAARRRDDLAAAAVDRVGVQRHVEQVDAHVTQRLVAEHTLLAHPLPAFA